MAYSKEKEYRINTTAYLSINQLDELEEIAQEKAQSKNACIDEAVKDYIAKCKKAV